MAAAIRRRKRAMSESGQSGVAYERNTFSSSAMQKSSKAGNIIGPKLSSRLKKNLMLKILQSKISGGVIRGAAKTCGG